MFLSPFRVWRGFSLGWRFATLAVLLATVSTLLIGAWVSHKIENGIVSRSAGIASVYISDLLAPLLQNLDSTGEISQYSFEKLDSLLVTGALRDRVVAIKIWAKDGTILYSTDRGSIGRRFPPGNSLNQAFGGAVVTEIDEPSGESAAEFKQHEVLFEVYAPIHDRTSGDVIAVAEFYEDAAELLDTAATAKVDTWMVICLILACNMSAFLAIVRGAGKTIELQRVQLTQRIDDISQAMAREKALRDQIERGARSAFDENERFLRLLGSDLHDGPAQLLGLALLRLDGPANRLDDATVAQARSAMSDAMRDLREIAAGLLLPDVSGQTLRQCVAATVRNHELRTLTKVTVACARLKVECPPRLKVCVCRFVQEGLANSFRHAGGVGQHVQVEGAADHILVTVADSGPGIPEGASPVDRRRLGLDSLRGRVQSLNGTLTVSSRPQGGTRLVAWLPLKEEQADAVQDQRRGGG